MCYHLLALVAYHQRRYEEARDLLERSFLLVRPLDYRWIL